MRHHLFVAGTGRAGTSLLVKLLAEIGLETHLDTAGGEEDWDRNANAGLEDLILHGENLPYVVKSPWLYEYVDELLTRDDIKMDAVIIPSRNLIEAASSRVIVEMTSIHQQATWMAGESSTWETWAATPGGAIYSLNPIDQARLLAVGFQKLFDRLVQAEIPIRFLAFPRFVEDADYLFRNLRGFLPDNVTLEVLAAAHRKVARQDEVRVGIETRAPRSLPGTFPSAETLDNAALRRILSMRQSSDEKLKWLLAEIADVLKWVEDQGPAATPTDAVLSGVVHHLQMLSDLNKDRKT